MPSAVLLHFPLPCSSPPLPSQSPFFLLFPVFTCRCCCCCCLSFVNQVDPFRLTNTVNIHKVCVCILLCCPSCWTIAWRCKIRVEHRFLTYCLLHANISFTAVAQQFPPFPRMPSPPPPPFRLLSLRAQLELSRFGCMEADAHQDGVGSAPDPPSPPPLSVHCPGRSLSSCLSTLCPIHPHPLNVWASQLHPAVERKEVKGQRRLNSCNTETGCFLFLVSVFDGC